MKKNLLKHSVMQMKDISISLKNIFKTELNVISLIFLSAVSACGPEYDAKQSFKVDSEFKELISIFEKEQDVKVNIDVIFNSLESTTIGVCYWYEEDNKKVGVRVEIDPEFWFESVEAAREELLFHELGHCILGRDHDTTLLYGAMPKSVMYPYVFSTTYLVFRDYYVKELKDPETQLTNYHSVMYK